MTEDIKQKTQAWFELRRGKLTGSIMNVIVNGGVIGKNTLLESMRYELENPEVPIKSVQLNAASILHGVNTEPEAIAHYEMINDVDVEQPAFVVHPTIPYIGCSPDFKALIDGNVVVVGEVKCPYKIEVHEANVLYSAGVQTYQAQMQCELEVTGADVCHFISYAPKYQDPHKRYVQIDVFRDEAFIEKMLMKCEEFYEKLTNNERFENLTTSDSIPKLF